MSSKEVWNLFSSKENKVDILLYALEIMQGDSTRTKTECIALAMGIPEVK